MVGWIEVPEAREVSLVTGTGQKSRIMEKTDGSKRHAATTTKRQRSTPYENQQKTQCRTKGVMRPPGKPVSKRYATVKESLMNIGYSMPNTDYSTVELPDRLTHILCYIAFLEAQIAALAPDKNLVSPDNVPLLTSLGLYKTLFEPYKELSSVVDLESPKTPGCGDNFQEERGDESMLICTEENDPLIMDLFPEAAGLGGDEKSETSAASDGDDMDTTMCCEWCVCTSKQDESESLLSTEDDEVTLVEDDEVNLILHLAKQISQSQYECAEGDDNTTKSLKLLLSRIKLAAERAIKLVRGPRTFDVGHNDSLQPSTSK